jgi:uncharacterized protein YodC (DUF2158 family)
MTQLFKINDVVRLRTGGAPMNVEKYDDEGLVICTWQDKDHRPQKEAYPEALLVKYKPPGNPVAGGERPPTSPPGMGF